MCIVCVCVYVYCVCIVCIVCVCVCVWCVCVLRVYCVLPAFFGVFVSLVVELQGNLRIQTDPKVVVHHTLL